MTDLMVSEIITGIGKSGVCCGIIGEIGCSWPLTSTERKALEAAALAQKQTGKAKFVGQNRSTNIVQNLNTTISPHLLYRSFW